MITVCGGGFCAVDKEYMPVSDAMCCGTVCVIGDIDAS